MEIKFSRHARRRMQLYKIDEDDVRDIIESVRISERLAVGKHEILNHNLKTKYGYTLMRRYLWGKRNRRFKFLMK